ncbi:MAG TPA: aspartate ammonia-lyase [Methanosarcina sp.]|nr:aspartate ammonia-lyase [Methanosarcina sp.]
MATKIVSIETIKAERRKGTFQENVPFVLNGKNHVVTKNIVNGEMEIFDLEKPIGEMIVTDSSQKAFLEKIVLDVELGREETPLLYGPIYERKEDRNFPEVFDAKWAQRGIIVFAEHIEGEEVKFGHLQAEEGPIARIKTYAAGIEYTEDMQEYNQTFNLEEINRAFGEGHNALLNHLHLAPFIGFKYKPDNKTAAKLIDVEGNPVAQAKDAHPALSLRETLKAGLGDARLAKRPGNVLLVSGDRVDHIKEAMSAFHVRGTDYEALTGIDTIIAYDGWTAQVGKKATVYPGVSDTKAYLIRPKRGFKELIKHGLRIDANMGDLTRLIEAQIVGRSRNGVFAAIEENVQEITLPKF